MGGGQSVCITLHRTALHCTSTVEYASKECQTSTRVCRPNRKTEQHLDKTANRSCGVAVLWSTIIVHRLRLCARQQHRKMGTMEGVAHVPASSQRVRAGYDALTELATPLIVPPSSRRYNLQFSSLYDYRLRRLKHPKGRLLAAATRRWTEGIYDEADDDLKVDAIDSQTNEEDQASTSCVAGRTVTTTSRKRGRREERLPKANYVKRILDVKQGQICFVIGTIYCSMHLKPDVLEELTREVGIRGEAVDVRAES